MSLIKDLDVRLDIVGEGPERAVCTELVASNGLEARVTLHGWRSKAEVAAFYDQSDIFVFPSYREAGGNVALEAMGYSLPLVVVDRGGPGSATSANCAFKLKAENPQGLAEEIAAAVRRLASDRALRLRMGQSSREHVARTALWSAKLDRIDQIYDEVRQRAKPAQSASATTAN
jgi:glycosyltransferase involved in cell wall biosynthesis